MEKTESLLHFARGKEAQRYILGEGWPSKGNVRRKRLGEREDLTSFGTLKIDIFEVFGCVNLGGEKSLQIWTRLEETLLDPFF